VFKNFGKGTKCILDNAKIVDFCILKNAKGGHLVWQVQIYSALILLKSFHVIAKFL
jgi:hypothetical protein